MSFLEGAMMWDGLSWVGTFDREIERDMAGIDVKVSRVSFL